jgi:hypothetical protein
MVEIIGLSFQPSFCRSGSWLKFEIENLVKQIIHVASAILSLGMGTAFAQGIPAGDRHGVYGSHPSPNQQTGTIERNVAPAKVG